MAGTKYTIKQDLIDAVVKFIFPNKKKLITGINHQTAMLDMVESLWDRFANSVVTDVTYGDLINIKNNNNLVPLSYYRISYKTVHHIFGTVGVYNDTTTVYDKGDRSLSTFVPETETLLLKALSTNELYHVALSEQYPKDLIHYNIDDNLTEDSLRSRDGFIHYRLDTEKNLSAHYDWRNCLNRRYESDQMMNPASWDTYARNYADTIDILSSQNRALPPYATKSGTFTPGSLDFTVNSAGQVRDFKTFVGLGETGVFTAFDGGYYRNVKIGLNHSATFVSGSGSGSAVPAPPSSGRVTNVVIYAKSAYDIEIGSNCNGITMIGSDFRNVNVGNTNQDVYLGGLACVTLGPPGQPVGVQGYYENINIGNSNKDIAIADFMRNITIGNSNTGITLCFDSANSSIGNENKNIFMSYFSDIRMEDQNFKFLLRNHHNLEVGTYNNDVRIYGTSSIYSNGLLANSGVFPIGGSPNYGALVSPRSVINNNTYQISVSLTSRFDIRSKSQRVTIHLSDETKIGLNCRDIVVTNCPKAVVEDDCWKVDISSSSLGDILVSKNCLNVTLSGSFIKVGAYCTYVMINANSYDINVEENCTGVYMTSCQTAFIGAFNSQIHARNSNGITTGRGCNNVFYETSNNNTIGANCSNISFNNFNIKFYFNIDNLFTNFLLSTLPVLNTARYWGRTPLSILSPLNLSLVQREEASFPNNLVNGSSNNVLGSNCFNIFFTSSNLNVLGNYVTDVSFGTELSNTLPTYFISFDSMTGIPAPYNSATIIANGQYTGKGCNANHFLSGTTLTKLKGSDNSGNTFSGQGSINTTLTASLVRSSVSVPVAVTPTVAIADASIDAKSPDNSAWYTVVNNAGVETRTKVI